MSQSLNSCLTEISESLEEINNRKFRPSGIFHNAVIHGMLAKGGKKEFVKLLRDGEPNEELSLFKVDRSARTIKRRDGKSGVHSYVVDKESRLKRNRRMGLQDPKPVIQIPKEFYLAQHEKAIQDKSTAVTRNSFILPNTLGDTIQGSGAFSTLFAAFKDDTQTTKLLEALQNGSVLVEEDNSASKVQDGSTTHRTMFVEDFPINLIISVIDKIESVWSLSNFKEEFHTLRNSSEELLHKITETKQLLEDQENEMNTHDVGTNSSSRITKLITTHRQEIAELEEEIRRLDDQHK